MPLSSLIPVGAWLWDKYGKSVTDKTADAVKGRWNKFRWADAAEKYRAKIKKLYGTMQIMGMAEPVSLEDIFTDVYLLDKPTALARFDIERLKEMSDSDRPPQYARRTNGLQLVVEKQKRYNNETNKFEGEKDKKLYVLGKPGAGKTTFLKYIALKAAEQTVDKVPIFVSLKHWSDSGLRLVPFIAERFDVCDFPAAQPFVEEVLKSGSAIVLFDGLDEVNQEGGKRDSQTREIRTFVEKYDKAQCIITCRIAASDYSFQPFTYVEIADFTESQILTFVRNWFRNQEGEKDEDTSRKFLREFSAEDKKGLRDLARTPLLLTLLCLAFDETLTFPRRRVEIYQEALDALLKKWDSTRRIKRDEIYRKLSLGHKENMLARIATETFEKNDYFIPQAELERLIAAYVKNVPPHESDEGADGEAILKAIEAQHGIFVERARKVYSFSHLTLQEYFTAKYIVSNRDRRTLNNLASHCAEKRWREVLLLTTSLLPDASEFMKILRRSIDALLEPEEKLKALLEWADKKSAQIQTDPLLVRIGYLSFEARTHLALTLKRPWTLAREVDLNIELDRALSLTRVTDITSARTFANELGLSELEAELAAISAPTQDAPAETREEFARNVQAVTIKHRGIWPQWNLTATQRARLAEYVEACTLLQECLELAFIPPDEKKAMLNSLYLPPRAIESEAAQ